MRKMTIGDIQSVSIKMMNDIHQFCEKRGIRYSLAYGTLLGAIRHKGFIPWDEDVDIWMPRKDYENFIANYKSEKGCFFTSYKTMGNFIDFARLYETDETLVEGALADNVRPTGVWIDIFPIDSVSENKELREKEYQKIKKIWWRIRRLRRLYNLKKDESFLKRMYGRVLYFGRQKLFGELFDLINLSNKLSSLHQSESSGVCASLMCRDAFWKNKMETFPSEWFESFELVTFQSFKFYVVRQYDKVLNSIYGDFMKLPPVEKQKPRFDHVFLWKKD